MSVLKKGGHERIITPDRRRIERDTNGKGKRLGSFTRAGATSDGGGRRSWRGRSSRCSGSIRSRRWMRRRSWIRRRSSSRRTALVGFERNGLGGGKERGRLRGAGRGSG
ncbi:unnamed protein product [Closterium sp. NIES-54]